MIKYIRAIYYSLKSFFGVNWIKTLYFNFRMFDFTTACKLPVYFYGPVHFQNLAGQVKIEGPITRAMVGFGQRYEMNTVHAGTAEIVIAGKLVFKGPAQFGKDYFLFVGQDSVLEFGYMAGIASDSKIICSKKIVLGKYARAGSECFITDTDFHPIFNTITGEKREMQKPIILGNYNYIGTRVFIGKGTITPDYCTVASNSYCNKDYSSLGQNVLIAGIPANLIRNNISRDWEGEQGLIALWMKP